VPLQNKGCRPELAMKKKFLWILPSALENGCLGETALPLDFHADESPSVAFGEWIGRGKQKQISLEELLKLYRISRSTFYRRLKHYQRAPSHTASRVSKSVPFDST
jgi:hypothetical protein